MNPTDHPRQSHHRPHDNVPLSTEARLKAIIEAEQECVKVVSLDGYLMEMNAAGLAMLEADTLEQARCKPLIEYVAAEYRGDFLRHFKDTIDEKRPAPLEFEIVGLKGGRRWLETNGVALKDSHNATIALLSVSKDITKRKKSEQAMHESLALQQVLIRMATDFVNVPIETIDRAINEALETIGRFVGADRAYLFRYDIAAETMSNTHEWCAEGVSHELQNSQNIPFAWLPEVVEAHRRGEVFVLPRVSSLPQGARFRSLLEAQHIQSLILFPMAHGKELLGFVGFDAVRAPRVYTDTETSLLKVLAEILANAELRRRSDASLRKSEENFRALVETTSDFIWEVDAACVYTYVSPQIQNMLGYSPTEVLGKTPFDFMPPDEAARMQEQFQSILDARSSFTNLQNINRHKDGHLVVFETSGTPVFDQAGNLRGYRGIDRDITDRARAEEKVRENEERLRLTLMAANQGLYDLNVQTGEATVSPEYARMLGYEPEELHETNQKWQDRLHPDDREEVVRAYEEYIAGKRSEYRVEFRQRTKSGAWIWILSIGKIVARDKRGRPLRMLGTHTEITERKQTMLELAANERLYRTLFNLSPAGILLIDSNGVILEVNDTFYRTHQYTCEELVGKHVTILVPPEEHHRVEEHLQRILSGETFEHEVVNLRKDGTPCIVELRETAILLPNGRRGILSVANDITKRKQAEDALRESEQKFRTVVQNAQAVVFILDDAGVFQLSEGQALARLGLKPGEVVGRSALEMYKSYPEIIEGITRALRGEQTRVTAQVQGYTFDTLYSPYFDRTGKLAGVVGVATDITERIRSEELLRKSEERYRRLFEEDLAGVFFSYPDGTIMDCNPAFVRMFGFRSRDEVLRTNAAQLYQSVEQRNELLKLLRERGRLQNHEMTLRRMDGTTIHVLENIIATFDEQGRLIQQMGYITDITAQRQLEQQLLQSQKLESIGTLASGIAHDFNNILGIILGHATLMAEARMTQAQAHRHTEAILKATERGIALVKQLLTFARKAEVRLESVRLNDLIDELTTFLRETFPRSITIETSLAQNLPSITADVNQMHQVLLNLCVNARDAMPAGGRLTITTWITSREEARRRWPTAAASEYVALSVTDTGCGMDDQTRARIFEPFFTTKGPGKGTGLGLATVYGIVQTHKGFIDVESQPDHGTSFLLFFPVQPRIIEQQVAVPSSHINIPGGNETILFVEDEPMLQEMVVELLTEKGYSVLTASDGLTGAELYSQHRERIALVISDLGLPRLGGDELFLQIQSLNPKIKFILASGFIEPGVKARMMERGLKYVINKPYHPSQVLSMIRTALDEP